MDTVIRNLYRRLVLGCNRYQCAANTVSPISPWCLRSGAWTLASTDKMSSLLVVIGLGWTLELFWRLSEVLMFGFPLKDLGVTGNFRSSLGDSYAQPKLRITSLHKCSNRPAVLQFSSKLLLASGSHVPLCLSLPVLNGTSSSSPVRPFLFCILSFQDYVVCKYIQ